MAEQQQLSRDQIGRVIHYIRKHLQTHADEGKPLKIVLCPESEQQVELSIVSVRYVANVIDIAAPGTDALQKSLRDNKSRQTLSIAVVKLLHERKVLHPPVLADQAISRSKFRFDFDFVRAISTTRVNATFPIMSQFMSAIVSIDIILRAAGVHTSHQQVWDHVTGRAKSVDKERVLPFREALSLVGQALEPLIDEILLRFHEHKDIIAAHMSRQFAADAVGPIDEEEAAKNQVISALNDITELETSIEAETEASQLRDYQIEGLRERISEVKGVLRQLRTQRVEEMHQERERQQDLEEARQRELEEARREARRERNRRRERPPPEDHEENDEDEDEDEDGAPDEAEAQREADRLAEQEERARAVAQRGRRRQRREDRGVPIPQEAMDSVWGSVERAVQGGAPAPVRSLEEQAEGLLAELKTAQARMTTLSNVVDMTPELLRQLAERKEFLQQQRDRVAELQAARAARVARQGEEGQMAFEGRPIGAPLTRDHMTAFEGHACDSALMQTHAILSEDPELAQLFQQNQSARKASVQKDAILWFARINVLSWLDLREQPDPQSPPPWKEELLQKLFSTDLGSPLRFLMELAPVDLDTSELAEAGLNSSVVFSERLREALQPYAPQQEASQRTLPRGRTPPLRSTPKNPRSVQGGAQASNRKLDTGSEQKRPPPAAVALQSSGFRTASGLFQHPLQLGTATLYVRDKGLIHDKDFAVLRANSMVREALDARDEWMRSKGLTPVPRAGPGGVVKMEVKQAAAPPPAAPLPSPSPIAGRVGLMRATPRPDRSRMEPQQLDSVRAWPPVVPLPGTAREPRRVQHVTEWRPAEASEAKDAPQQPANGGIVPRQGQVCMLELPLDSPLTVRAALRQLNSVPATQLALDARPARSRADFSDEPIPLPVEEALHALHAEGRLEACYNRYLNDSNSLGLMLRLQLVDDRAADREARHTRVRLDGGADYSVIHHRVVKSLGLEAQVAKLGEAINLGGAAFPFHCDGKLTLTFKLGSAHSVFTWKFLVMPDSYPSADTFVLGGDWFKAYHVMPDQAYMTVCWDLQFGVKEREYTSLLEIVRWDEIEGKAFCQGKERGVGL